MSFTEANTYFKVTDTFNITTIFYFKNQHKKLCKNLLDLLTQSVLLTKQQLK